MKKPLLILLCFTLLFSCGSKEETQKNSEYIGKTDEAIKKDIIEVIQQFNIRNNYEEKQQHLDFDPCALIDSIIPIAIQINKIALENDYNVILENDVKFQELSNTFIKILPLIIRVAEVITTMGRNGKNKKLKEQLEKCTNDEYNVEFTKLFQNKRLEEWFILQNLVFGLQLLDQGDIHIPIY